MANNPYGYMSPDVTTRQMQQQPRQGIGRMTAQGAQGQNSMAGGSGGITMDMGMSPNQSWNQGGGQRQDFGGYSPTGMGNQVGMSPYGLSSLGQNRGMQQQQQGAPQNSMGMGMGGNNPQQNQMWNAPNPNAGGGGGMQASSIDPPTDPSGLSNNPYAQHQNIFDPTQWQNATTAQQYQQYLDNTLPLAQFQQNQAQYGMDFSEAQRRWNEEMARQGGLDQYQQGIGNRQMTLAEQQAAAAQGQWQQQFGQTQANDQFSQGLANRQFASQEEARLYAQAMQNRQFGQQQSNDLFSQGLQNRQFDMAQGQQNWNQNFQQGQQAWTQNIQQQQQNVDAQYRAGLIDVQQMQNEIARINNQNQFTLGQGQNSNQLLNYQNQFTLGDQQNRLQAQQNQNQYTLGQQQNSNQLLNYQNQYELGQGRLGVDNRQLDIQQTNNQGRLGLDTRLGVGNLDLNRQRLASEAQQAAAARATQERIAAIQASGRAQIPTARFVQNW